MTPARESYLTGPWTFCNNRQYKWKPADQLTVDFAIGKFLLEKETQVEDDEEQKTQIVYYYTLQVKRGKDLA